MLSEIITDRLTHIDSVVPLLSSTSFDFLLALCEIPCEQNILSQMSRKCRKEKLSALGAVQLFECICKLNDHNLLKQ